LRELRTELNKKTMDINDEIDMQDLKYKVKELQEKNEELQVELDITKEQLILSGVSHQRELLPEFLMHDLDGKIITSVIGSADVTKEWNEYLGNCG
jgi:hypothetical protein